MRALIDENAEIRVQATYALGLLMNQTEAIKQVVQEALKEGKDENQFCYLINAIRIIDPSRQLSGEIITKELDSEDQGRRALAEKMLAELGGWIALQRLNRRESLKQSYLLLEKSEEGVQTAFQNTTRQATRNFYFAMGVNIIVVTVGIALVAIAVMQLLQKPDNLVSWVTPGTGGVLGIILTMYFNGPRKNAREDLTTLMNANCIYLGYLRMLNEIDATFKHAYVENPNFGPSEMMQTVGRIETALQTTLKHTAKYLLIPT